MPLNFLSKKPAGSAASTPKTTTAPTSSAPKTQTPEKKSGGVSFLKRGAAARQTVADEEQKAELIKESYGKLWRFFTKPDETDVAITFIDGNLDEEGMLDVVVGYEHRVKFNGQNENFVCTADIDKEQPCPICERGDSRSEMVAYLTVIDHTARKSTRDGKITQHKKKLFAFKKTTLKQLTALAKKRNGLAGCRFDVARSGDKAAAVGDSFDFTEKLSLEDVQSKYGLTGEDVTPADYDSELSYRTPDELITLGVGKKPGGIGYEQGVKDKGQKSKLGDEL